MRHQEYSSSDDPLIGRLVAGKFQIRRCVGIGASGAVYQADQVSLGRTVAVKVIRPELSSDGRLVKRFHDEALAASRLNHPNTVSVIDYGQTDDGLLFIVMEFLRGRTLTEVIDEDGPLPADRVADLMQQILSGLEEAHANGVIHADLKADNVVVERRRGDWDLAKVVDFGIARLVNAPREESAEKTVSGTPEYMAPELIGGADPTVETDVYAAGAMLYEMLVGRTPFAGGVNSLEVLTRHLRDTPIPPSTRAPDRPVNPSLERAALRALEKRPEHRFSAASTFRAAVSMAITPHPSEDRIMCDGCGVLSSSSFRFCPDCGHRRGAPRRGSAELSPRLVAAAFARADTEAADVLAVVHNETADTHATRPRVRDDTLIDAPPVDDHLAGGLFPLPMVGRELEAGALREFIMFSGAAPALQLVGDAGTGRSRMVREACAEAASQGVKVCLVGADPTGMRAPYYPIRAMVAAALPLPDACTVEQLGHALAELGLSPRDLPGLADLLGHETELAQLEPDVRRRELLASTLRALQAATRGGRVAMVFEDAERYDGPSQELLRRLAEAPGSELLRVIVTGDRALAERLPARGDRVELGPLPPRAIEAIAAHLRRVGNDALPDEGAIARHTDGTPAFIAHLVRYVTEGGSVAGAPSTAADLVAARLELLPRQASWALQAIAVMGCEASRDEVSAMLQAVDEDTIDEALRLLDARALLVLDDDVAWIDQELVRNVAYEATPADVRRELHAAAVRVLSEQQTDAALLGHHCERSRLLEDAAELLALAGDEAVHQLDDGGACSLYNRALACSRELMLGSADEGHEQFVTTSIKLAEALRVTSEVALARGLVEEARAHAQGAPALEAQLLRASAHLYQTEGEPDTAVRMIRDAIGIALTVGHADLLAELYLELSSAFMRVGEPERAVAELDEAVNLVTLGEGMSASAGPAAMWRLLLRLAQLHRANQASGPALAAARAARAHATKASSRVGVARSDALLAQLYDEAGDGEAAEHYRRTAVEEMRRLGDRRATAELLLTGSSPTRNIKRIAPAQLAEARELASEIGWTEGLRRAAEASRAPISLLPS